ncbi:hypothetical protein RCO28_34610 [Streptomyces sp. LHD-70]|uniref:hypothetical protein n=1 Tax=Streptomyces sp. LHD-70 TaxID=3072140 RepID=UPI00280DB0E6|nr:hypothetical protein [Streptomyces sp. LHD-70]MDQ8707566.1 hypothetical protein [Streptomyces sp. LHD-70]
MHQPDLDHAEYDPEQDLARQPLLTFTEARELLDLLDDVARSHAPTAVEARRLAHLLAYRVPERQDAEG